MSEFIKVEKDGEVIEVHPDALADHKRLGWVEVAVAVEAPEEKPDKPEAAEKKVKK